ncbi:hypothetical protein JXB02_04340 [Candidatus Woesearchaeota archaeon]|nr:hypothetical protein [Candidatus Woesearchaeota archaeon]
MASSMRKTLLIPILMLLILLPFHTAVALSGEGDMVYSSTSAGTIRARGFAQVARIDGRAESSSSGERLALLASSFRAKGIGDEHAVDGFLALGEDMTLEVTAFVPDVSSTNLLDADNQPYYSCQCGVSSSAPTWTDCSCGLTHAQVNPGGHEQVALLKLTLDWPVQPNPITETDYVIMKVDGTAPLVDDVTAAVGMDREVGKGNITTAYTIHDRPAGSCSGVNQTTVKIEGGLTVKTESIDDESCAASVSRDVVWNPYEVTSGNADGNISVCVSGKDRLGHETDDTSRKCDWFLLDTTAPGPCDVVFAGASGFETHYVRDHTSRAVIIANITDAGLGIDYSKVTANLSDLGLGAEVHPTNDCPNVSQDVYQCVWNVTLNLPTSTDSFLIELPFNVSDAVRNNDSNVCSLSWDLWVDDEPPTVVQVTTEANGYIGKEVNNTLWVEFSGSGDDFEIEDVFINISDMTKDGDPAHDLHFDECQGAQCKIEGLMCGSHQQCNTTPSTDIVVSIKGVDIAGNTIDNISTLHKDFTPPSLPYTYSVTNAANRIFHRTGDTLVFSLINSSDTESGGVWAIGNFSEITTTLASTGGESEVLCDDLNNNYTCTWAGADAILANRPQAFQGNLSFTLYDRLMNPRPYNVTVEILLFNESLDPDNYYELYNTSMYPIEINTLKGLKSSTYYQYVPIKLENNGNCQYEPLFILTYKFGGVSCTGSGSGAYVTLVGPDEDDHYIGFLEFDISTSAIESIVNTPSFTVFPLFPTLGECTFEMLVRCGDQAYVEIENVSYNISLVEDTVHTDGPDTGMIDEINRIKDKVKDTGWQTDIQGWIDWGTTLCQLKSLIASVHSIVVGVGIVLATCAEAANPASGFCEAINVKLSGVASFLENFESDSTGLWKILNWACAFITCSYSEVPDLESISWCDNIAKDLASYGNPLAEPPSTLEICKQSWPVSVVCLCLPGIIYHLNQKRQTDCFRAFCYQNLTTVGWTKKDCDNTYDYMKCLNDQLGNWGAPIIDILMSISGINKIIDIISNPLKYAWPLVKDTALTGCKGEPKSVVTWIGCAVYLGLLVFEAIGTFEQISTTMQALGSPDYQPTDYCELLGEGSTW